jgi:hypothetical protein
MRFYKAKIILISSFLVVGFMGAPVQAGDGVLFIAARLRIPIWLP